MEEVLSKLKTLTPDQLRQQVIGAGLKCGPVTATTRAIFERKLARTLLEKQGGDGGVPDGSDCGGSSSNEQARGPTDREEGPSDHSSELKSPAKEGIKGPCEEIEDLSQPESPIVYYGVCPHWEDSMVRDDKIHIYMDRKKALRVMMTMKGARFKGFSTLEEAKKFAEGTNDHLASASLTTPDGPQGMLEPVVHTGSPVAGGTSPGNWEKANEYRSPRTQDLTAKLRKAVEQGDQAAFSRLVWDNPRYLIGSGDNPTIVHEGCHYNVLHVASKANQSGITQLLLDTMESPEFMRLMYPDDQENILHQRIRYIVDLYLNMPDKGGNETPLHFACKFGCPDVVNVLCSHPATDKHRKNKYSQKPSSVICERKSKSPDIKKKIKEYLEDRCYIPLLRDTDNSFQPVIGLPWSPCPLEMDLHSPGSEVAGSPIDPVMTVRAYMGPLSPSKAAELYRRWRTPPKDQAQYFHRILKSDPDRGAERVGREIAHDTGHPWAEYWDFLDSFIDLSTEEGLKRLEDYLEKKEHSESSREEGRGTEATSEEVRSPKEKKKQNLNVQSNHIFKDKHSPPKDRSSLSLVCNLLPEFDKAIPKSTVEHQDEVESEDDRLAPSIPGTGGEGLDLEDSSFWRTWGRSQGRRDVEELSSTCSEEYLTADEGSVGSGCHRERGERRGSGSSSSSYESTQDTSVDTVLMAPTTPTRQGLFIEGVSPTKLDREVISAVNNMEIDPVRYPCVTQWRDTILAYPSPQRLSWPSPTGKRSFTGTPDGTPSRLGSMWQPASSSFQSPSGLHSPSQSAYTQHILHRNLFRSPH